MLTIGVDGREICDRPAGKGQYLLRVLWQWQQLPDVHLIIYTYPGQTLPNTLEKNRILQIEQPGKGPFWHWAVGRRLSSDKIQVFFAALSYLSAFWNQVPTVTVVHDLAVFRLAKFAHNRKAQIVEKLSLRHCIKKSAHIIAVSESTKRDLLELMQASASKISVVGEASLLGVEEGVKPLPFKKRQPFFLFTGTLEPRKNIRTLLEAYATLPGEVRQTYRLKLAGKPGWGGEDYSGLAAELDIQDSVDFLGYVSDSDLKTLFIQATLFLFPSLYEGFGLPVIEAMSVGTPVITSTTSSLPEVAGPEGITCNPEDSEAIAKQITRLLSDEKSYAEYSKYLFERSKQFRWSEVAQELLIILQKYC